VSIRPIKGLFKRLLWIVGVVFGVYPVANDKNLYVLKQPIGSPERMPLITIDLVKGFFEFQPPFFEFYLYQWQPIDKKRNIIAVFIRTFVFDLARNLLLVLTPKIHVQKLNVNALPVFPCQLHLIPQDFSPFKDVAFVEVVEYLPKFPIGKPNVIMLL